MASRGITKIFIGNLPWTVGHRELVSYFKQFGKVLNANVVFDKRSGHSKGYGFVTFLNKSALDNLDNKTVHLLEGNNLNIQKTE
ncbi:uncharacterized protein LOC129605447 [Condylostylus longicornis]|uniref:uncharacterized protein LOC129605447 n=1 Tax=Condylostylus longicornis TaxID=2530218 RepID=UPI00244E567B|nr:uncharacterized protein LOC129605447 [Condylostylus longicornis]